MLITQLCLIFDPCLKRVLCVLLGSSMGISTDADLTGLGRRMAGYQELARYDHS